MCCLPRDISTVSIYFDGFEREYQYFKNFPTHFVWTDARSKLSLDTNGHNFMGFGSLLYRDMLRGKYTTFGTVLEAGDENILYKTSEPSESNNVFFGSGMELLCFTHALTELGTALIVMCYMPNETINSLKSLAGPGSEKLYRKECLINIACRMQGKEEIVKKYHYPRSKIVFGEHFASDFLSFCIAKYLGVPYVLDLYAELPSGFEEFVNNHDLLFYSKIKQDMLSKTPEELLNYYRQKLFAAGLEYYSDEDYQEMREVGDYLRNIYRKRPKKNSKEHIDFRLNDKLRDYKSVILYGAGKVGQDYYRQLIEKDVSVYWVDEKYNYYRNQGYDVNPINDLGQIDYDVVIIATVEDDFMKSMREELLTQGIPEEKIITC